MDLHLHMYNIRPCMLRPIRARPKLFIRIRTLSSSPSGVQELTRTPSMPFRHLHPNSARFSYATEGALFISAQLSTDAVSALQKVRVLITLRAPLSGTFIQTLPDLVTPLKGHSLTPRSCPPTRSAPSERFGH